MRWDVTGKHWLSLLCSGREHPLPSSAGEPERGFPGVRKRTRAPSRPRSLLEPGAASDSGGGSWPPSRSLEMLQFCSQMSCSPTFV